MAVCVLLRFILTPGQSQYKVRVAKTTQHALKQVRVQFIGTFDADALCVRAKGVIREDD